jgi:hypothetical protein
MYVIFNAADRQRRDVYLAANPHHIGPELWPDVFVDQLCSSLCAENDMEMMFRV